MSKSTVLYVALSMVTPALLAQRPLPPPTLQALFSGNALAPGDTLPYTLRWTAGSRAARYGVNVRPTRTNCAAWTGLPTAFETPNLSFTFRAICLTWDTVTFTASVWSIGANGVKSKDTSRVSWSTSKRPGGPGPITVDSSLIITALDIKPDAVNLVFGQQQQFCPMVRFHGGALAMPVDYRAIFTCAAFWSQVPLAGRAVARQQAVADTLCVRWQVTGGVITLAGCQSGTLGLRPIPGHVRVL